MSDIKPLPTPKYLASQSTIDALEEMLAHAKAGTILEVAACVVWSDGHTGTYLSQSNSPGRLIGGLFIALHDLTASAIQSGGPAPRSDE